MSAECETFAATLKASRAHTANITQSGWLANLKNHWSKDILPLSSQNCNPFDFFMWSEVWREVNTCPHITLASLKVMTSDVMTDLDREVIIHACKQFWSWIEAVMEPTGVFINWICMLYANILTLKFSSKYIDPNYLFYWFECFHKICPNLSSAPCRKVSNQNT